MVDLTKGLKLKISKSGIQSLITSKIKNIRNDQELLQPVSIISEANILNYLSEGVCVQSSFTSYQNV